MNVTDESILLARINELESALNWATCHNWGHFNESPAERVALAIREGRAEGRRVEALDTLYPAPVLTDTQAEDAIMNAYDIHTCHDECPCHTSDKPMSDFIEWGGREVL